MTILTTGHGARRLRIALAALSILGAGIAASQAQAQTSIIDQNAKTSKGYVLMQAEMTNPDAFFSRYAVPAEVVVSAHRGQALVATFGKTVLEGQWDNNWTIMLAFPSVAAASAWYHSPAYQAVIPERKAATAFGNMVLFEGAPESVLKWSVARYEGVKAALAFPLTLDPTPEYVVGATPVWTAPDGRFALRASFDELDAANGALALELRLAEAYIGDGHLGAHVYLIDAAGKRASVGRIAAGEVGVGEWTRFEFALDGAGQAEAGRATAVEIEFRANRKPVQVAGPIALRNLRIVK